ncbi:MAG: hypothetical protein IJQ89_06615, partial [Bacteroidales bacterium]|nr:hypothetical protein [Bacteroidales bacterium]
MAQGIENNTYIISSAYTATAVQDGRLEIRSVSLTLTADSLAKDAPTTFYALPLRSEQLHPVPATLKLVTAGNNHGYRLLPNGDHFPKGATLR